MQIANAMADYDYYKNSRADTAAITARERKKTETRPRRYVAARLVGCLSVSSPLSPPPLGFSLRLLVVSFMSSAFLLRRHLAFCQLASFLISLCHQKTKKKILFFLRLKLLLFWATSCSYAYSRQDFHCRSSVSPVLPFTIFIAGDAKSIKVQLLLSISQRERNYSKCVLIIHTHTHILTHRHMRFCCVCWYACSYALCFFVPFIKAIAFLIAFICLLIMCLCSLPLSRSLFLSPLFVFIFCLCFDAYLLLQPTATLAAISTSAAKSTAERDKRRWLRWFNELAIFITICNQKVKQTLGTININIEQHTQNKSTHGLHCGTTWHFN